VALKPSTGGAFVIEIFHIHDGSGEPTSIQNHILWGRRTEGGFPETKELKRRVRDVIDPARDLGHVDRHPATTALPPSLPYDTYSSTSAPAPMLNRQESLSSGETISEATILTCISLESGGGNGEAIDENGEEA